MRGQCAVASHADEERLLGQFKTYESSGGRVIKIVPAVLRSRLWQRTGRAIGDKANR